MTAAGGGGGRSLARFNQPPGSFRTQQILPCPCCTPVQGLSSDSRTRALLVVEVVRGGGGGGGGDGGGVKTRRSSRNTPSHPSRLTVVVKGQPGS